LPSAPDVLAFKRDDAFACVLNAGPEAVRLDQLGLPGPLALASAPITRPGILPAETAAWFC
jgi:hypothetical protein